MEVSLEKDVAVSTVIYRCIVEQEILMLCYNNEDDVPCTQALGHCCLTHPLRICCQFRAGAVTRLTYFAICVHLKLLQLLLFGYFQ